MSYDLFFETKFFQDSYYSFSALTASKQFPYIQSFLVIPCLLI